MMKAYREENNTNTPLLLTFTELSAYISSNVKI